MPPIVRWTIGPVQPAGFTCLKYSIENFLNLYPCNPYICHNQLSEQQIASLEKMGVHLLDQQSHPLHSIISPIGVAWKLLPPRIDINCRELFIDNDLIINEKIEEIDYFMNNDCTLLLEADSRNYGQFEQHVPPGKNINSGLFGLPVGFDLEKFIDFYVKKWEENSSKLSKTFDEQGLIAFLLLGYKECKIISRDIIKNCEHHYEVGKGLHFVGLNRSPHHHSFAHFRSTMMLHL